MTNLVRCPECGSYRRAKTKHKEYCRSCGHVFKTVANNKPPAKETGGSWWWLVALFAGLVFVCFILPQLLAMI